MAKTQLKAVIIFLALLPGACLTLAQEPPVAQAPPPIQFSDWREVDRAEDHLEFTLSFPSAMTTEFAANNIVPLRIFLPTAPAGPFPAVIVLHYWGASDLKVERALAAELNRDGVAAVLLTLPYHLARTPPGYGSGALALRPDPRLLISNMTQSVWDVRRALDFLRTRPEFDPTRIGVAGSSLGAIVATMAYAVDERIRAAAFILGGVDIAQLIWNSSRTVRERDQLRRKGYTEEKLRAELEPVEPLPFLKRRTTGTTFVITANYDTVIPRNSSRQLIEALHSPKTLFVDTGHYGGVFVQRRLLREVARFFHDEFGGKDFVPLRSIYAPTVRIGGLASTTSGFDLAAGLDIWKFDHRGDGFASLLLTPRGPGLFLGYRIDSRISVGGIATRRRAGLGLFWSTVL